MEVFRDYAFDHAYIPVRGYMMIFFERSNNIIQITIENAKSLLHKNPADFLNISLEWTK